MVGIDQKTKVLLILSRNALDRARVFAGKATTMLKLPVSLQIVLRALIEEGLKRDDHAALLANVESQARAVREKRTQTRRKATGRTPGTRRSGASATNAGPRRSRRQR